MANAATLLSLPRSLSRLKAPYITRDSDELAILRNPALIAWWSTRPGSMTLTSTSRVVEWRDLKNNIPLRPSTVGIQPIWQSLAGNVQAVAFGVTAGLDDAQNGALIGPSDNLMPRTTSLTYFAFGRTPVDAGSSFPGVMIGSATPFPDATNQGNFIGLGVGYGGSSQGRPAFFCRGDLDYATTTTNVRDDAWRAYTGVFQRTDVSAGNAILRINNVQVGTKSPIGQTDPIPVLEGTRKVRVGAAGGLDGALSRTWLGRLGDMMIFSADMQAAENASTLDDIHNLLMPRFGL